MLRVGYLAENTGKVGNLFKLSSERIMHETGHNTGNLAFLYSARKLLNADITFFNWHTKSKELKGKVDLLFFSAANFLNETSDLKNLALLVSELDVPCILVGIGAQSEKKDVVPNLKQGTIDFLREVSKRTTFIAVRGKYSQRVCEYYGVKNTEVLGCPSILINEDRKLGKVIEVKMKNPVERVAVHASVIKGYLIDTERELLRIIDFFDGSYIVQRPIEIMKIINRENLNKEEIVYLNKINNLLLPDLNSEEFEKKMRSKGVFFADVESWMHFLKSYSHAVGTRIHGTILPLSAGVPSVCITHDTRTSELAETLMIPRLHYSEFLQYSSSTKEMFANIEFNGGNFEDNRSEIAKKYSFLFKKMGLNISKKLKGF